MLWDGWNELNRMRTRPRIIICRRNPIYNQPSFRHLVCRNQRWRTTRWTFCDACCAATLPFGRNVTWWVDFNKVFIASSFLRGWKQLRGTLGKLFSFSCPFVPLLHNIFSWNHYSSLGLLKFFESFQIKFLVCSVLYNLSEADVRCRLGATRCIVPVLKPCVFIPFFMFFILPRGRNSGSLTGVWIIGNR